MKYCNKNNLGQERSTELTVEALVYHVEVIAARVRELVTLHPLSSRRQTMLMYSANLLKSQLNLCMCADSFVSLCGGQ